MAIHAREEHLPDTTLSTMTQSKIEEDGPQDDVQENNAQEEDGGEYVTGIKLWSILIAGTLVQFTMMLDQSIITTVRLWILEEYSE